MFSLFKKIQTLGLMRSSDLNILNLGKIIFFKSWKLAWPNSMGGQSECHLLH